MKGITILEARNLLRIFARQNERIKKLEGLLQGQGVSSVKITDLKANKITTGNLIVAVGVGSAVDGSITLDGINVQLRMADADDTRLLIGDDGT